MAADPKSIALRYAVEADLSKVDRALADILRLRNRFRGLQKKTSDDEGRLLAKALETAKEIASLATAAYDSLASLATPKSQDAVDKVKELVEQWRGVIADPYSQDKSATDRRVSMRFWPTSGSAQRIWLTSCDGPPGQWPVPFDLKFSPPLPYLRVWKR